MKEVNIKFATDSCRVVIGPGMLRQVASQLKDIGIDGKVVIITNPVIKELYGDKLINSLAERGFSPVLLQVPEGEEQKSLENVSRLYQGLTDAYVERITPVLALGGGVIGDLAGFAAATYLRGVPLVQIPTTLVAQVDSSIGGKVGVNYGQLKNMVGSFYQPRLVITDTYTLKSLPENIFTEGLAEVIKYAVIWDKDFFTFLENNLDRIKLLDSEIIEQTVFRSISIKAKIVETDEKESGLRSILNYGHTIGHAIETVSDFGIQHGAAVAIGMVAASKISSRMDRLSSSDLARIVAIIERAGLPTEVPNLATDRIIQAIAHDKKVLQEKIRFIMPEEIGKVFITDEVKDTLIKKALVS